MYLKTLFIRDAGPLSMVDISLPFEGTKPLPVVFVGPNGSGKSTIMSFVVNAIFGYKQIVFENTEIESGKVFRVRGASHIKYGKSWYQVKLKFSDDLTYDEWVLDRPRRNFENEITALPPTDEWKQIGDDDNTRYSLQIANHDIRKGDVRVAKLFSSNAVLYFPSDRFELPDWLNEEALSESLKFQSRINVRNRTHRQIFSRALLRPTLEWIRHVILDSELTDRRPVRFPAGEGHTIDGFVATLGPDAIILKSVRAILETVLFADRKSLRFVLGRRHSGQIGVTYAVNGEARHVSNLLSLSAGQAALFCIFANIIRDFDSSNEQVANLEGISGIVLIDEADLHLHVDLQYRVFPKLMQLFPLVQFVVTAHSPLLLMGMRKQMDDSFLIVSLPDGKPLLCEQFSEFDAAFDAFADTEAFKSHVNRKLSEGERPLIVTEGITDVEHLTAAWGKLYPQVRIPWDIAHCGAYAEDNGKGGARMLKAILEAAAVCDVRSVIGLFDCDREGVEQFQGLDQRTFIAAANGHRIHQRGKSQALLLPTPPSRQKFVGSKATSCFLALEHLYPDDVLRQYNVADDPVVSDSSVFSITSESARKRRFSRAASALPVEVFAEFRQVFDVLLRISPPYGGVLVSEMTDGQSVCAPSVGPADEILKQACVVIDRHAAEGDKDVAVPPELMSDRLAADFITEVREERPDSPESEGGESNSLQSR